MGAEAEAALLPLVVEAGDLVRRVVAGVGQQRVLAGVSGRKRGTRVEETACMAPGSWQGQQVQSRGCTKDLLIFTSPSLPRVRRALSRPLSVLAHWCCSSRFSRLENTRR